MLARAGLVLLVAAALVAGLYWSQRRSEPFHVSGFLEADEIRVGSRVGGRVAEVHVEEGARVAAGAELFRLEPFDLLERRAEVAAELRAREAELARYEAGYRAEELAQAQARRDRLQAVLERLVNGPRPQEVAAARARKEADAAALELARLEEARKRALVETKIESAENLDRATAALRVAESDAVASAEALALLEEGTRAEEIAEARALLREADEELRLFETGFRPEDVAAARARVEAGQAELRVLERQLEELVVRAPAESTVQALDLQAGDLVAPDQAVVALLDEGRLWVRAYVPQGRLDLALGEAVQVTVDGLPGERFAGRVSFIARQAEFTPSNVQTPEERSQQVFRIRVTLEEGLGRLLPGTSADVWFERGARGAGAADG